MYITPASGGSPNIESATRERVQVKHSSGFPQRKNVGPAVAKSIKSRELDLIVYWWQWCSCCDLPVLSAASAVRLPSSLSLLSLLSLSSSLSLSLSPFRSRSDDFKVAATLPDLVALFAVPSKPKHVWPCREVRRDHNLVNHFEIIGTPL